MVPHEGVSELRFCCRNTPSSMTRYAPGLLPEPGEQGTAATPVLEGEDPA